MPRATLVEDCFVFSLHGVLREHRRGWAATFVLEVSLEPDHARVRVRVDVGKQIIPLLHERHNLAGMRWWFRCDCGARAFTLYRTPAAAHYRCRACCRLRYRCQTLSPAPQLEYRALQLS